MGDDCKHTHHNKLWQPKKLMFIQDLLKKINMFGTIKQTILD